MIIELIDLLNLRQAYNFSSWSKLDKQSPLPQNDFKHIPKTWVFDLFFEFCYIGTIAAEILYILGLHTLM